MRVLVTGAAGFVGQWVCNALLTRGDEVFGTTLEHPPASTGPSIGAVDWHRVDLRDHTGIQRLLDAARPETIVHLAGVTFVPAAAADPGTTFEVNTVATARLLGATAQRVKAGVLDPVVLVVGSGEQYGRHDLAGPLSETAAQRPLTVYGASKAAQEVVALQAHRSANVRVVCTRSFNHTGPGQSERLLVPALVHRALGLRGQADPRMPIGNLTPVRDFLHVRDVVDAYLLLAERGVPGEVYNVASGTGRSVRELVELVLARVGVEATLDPLPELMRPVDLPFLIGDPTKLCMATGWRPRSGLEHAIDELIDAASR